VVFGGIPLSERCVIEQVTNHHMVLTWPWTLTFWPQNLNSSSRCTQVVNSVKFPQAVC